MDSSPSFPSDQSKGDITDWNRIAEQYLQNNDSTGPTTNPMYLQIKSILWECLGDLRGLRVLDLGCGDGWFASLMTDAGATVVGIDGSDQLLKFGQKRDPRIDFLQANLFHGLPKRDFKFDRVVSLMVLMDIPGLDSLFSDLKEVLVNAGKFIFVILHPCFFNYKIHLDELTNEWYRRVTTYQDKQIWRIESFGGHNHYHRNLTYYADQLHKAGFAITRLYEPEWNPDPTNEKANVARRWPICLFVEARPFRHIE